MSSLESQVENTDPWLMLTKVLLEKTQLDLTESCEKVIPTQPELVHSSVVSCPGTAEGPSRR